MTLNETAKWLENFYDSIKRGLKDIIARYGYLVVFVIMLIVGFSNTYYSWRELDTNWFYKLVHAFSAMVMFAIAYMIAREQGYIVWVRTLILAQYHRYWKKS